MGSCSNNSKLSIAKFHTNSSMADSDADKLKFVLNPLIPSNEDFKYIVGAMAEYRIPRGNIIGHLNITDLRSEGQ
jgi:hypothetical protein